MRYADHEPTSGMNKRLVFGVMTPLMLMVGAVIVGVGMLTIRDHKEYAEMANNTHFTNRTITASRGAIYDSTGAPLAWSATVYKVYIDPVNYRKEMDKIEEIMNERQAILDAGETLPPKTIVKTRQQIEDEIVHLLSTKLGITEDVILTAMEKDTQYYVLQSQVEKNVADELMAYFEKLGIESITTQQDSKRYYPQNELAAQVVGFTNSDNDGQYGLEAYYNDYLAGVNGRVTSAKDANGRTMPYRYSSTYDAQDGASLYLTIDPTLQYSVEKNLEEMCTKFEVRNRACGIIMNVNTGAIYAMATYPSFDLNDPTAIYDEGTANALAALPEEEYQEAYLNAREKQWKNKAITEIYTPGSVFKIFTASAAAFATGGSTINTLLGIPYGVCTLIVAVFIFLVTMFGTKVVRSAASTLSVLILIGLLVVLVPNIIAQHAAIGDAIQRMAGGEMSVLSNGQTGAPGPALWMAVLYFFFQLAVD